MFQKDILHIQSFPIPNPEMLGLCDLRESSSKQARLEKETASFSDIS